MSDLQSNEPLSLVAGDRWQWRRDDLSDFPASAWTLTYYFKSPTAQFNVAATASGEAFAVDVLPETSAAIAAGIYEWRAYVSISGDRREVDRGVLTVDVNFASSAIIDTRSHARKVLAAVEAVIEGRATKDQESYSINGRSLTRTPIDQLLQLRKTYLAHVQAEDAAARRQAGQKSGNTINVRFI